MTSDRSKILPLCPIRLRKTAIFQYRTNSGETLIEPINTLDAQALKLLIKESIREVMREEWFKFFEMLLPYVDDEEQAEIEASFSPADYQAEKFVDVTNWFENEN